MLPRLFFGAAALSLSLLVLTHERRRARVRRIYRVDDSSEAFDFVSDVITREFERYGVESKVELHGSVASIRTSRRAHGEIESALWSCRYGMSGVSTTV